MPYPQACWIWIAKRDELSLSRAEKLFKEILNQTLEKQKKDKEEEDYMIKELIFLKDQDDEESDK